MTPPSPSFPQKWLAKHPRFHIHFIPTSSSWLNLIERWFRDLTDKRIRRGAFRSVPEVVEAIMTYINVHNADPKSFTWTAKIYRRLHLRLLTLSPLAGFWRGIGACPSGLGEGGGAVFIKNL